MDVQSAWTATQVRALAVTGLSSTHVKPFTRLLYNDPRQRGRASAVLVEGSGDDVVCSRRRERHGKFTASWSSVSGQTGELFNVHSSVDCIELQLWNQFANGFDVFLGQASVSLHQLQQQCSERSDVTCEVVTTGAMWFPLQASEGGLSSQLSLQLECVFVSDPKVLRVRDAIRRREKRTRRAQTGADKDAVDQETDQEERDNSVVDPTFAFTQPFAPVEWSLVAATNIRQLFFHAQVERLADFRELVLYADLNQELDDDEDLNIHDDHLAAFKLCQYSAQYLDHCVQTLSQRVEDFSDESRALDNTRTQLARKNRSLKAQRRRLQKEHDELELLITTYESVLNRSGNKLPVEGKPVASPAPSVSTTALVPDAESPPVSPTNSLSAKKPVFLKTWEEREHERRLEKEISKAQRIEEEKQRLNQRLLERKQQDEYEETIAKAIEAHRQRAARTIQTFFHKVVTTRHAQRLAARSHAATLVQSEWRRFRSVRDFPRLLQLHEQDRETKLMAQNEQESRQWAVSQQQELALPAPPEESVSAPISPSPSQEVVDALVATWRKLHRVFVLAHTRKGVDYQELFNEIDLRKDDVLDRAELRLGARSFGVRLDRTMTRALITLIRTKCGAPAKPLLITFAQFLQGFDLAKKETQHTATAGTTRVDTEAPSTEETPRSSSRSEDLNSDEALVAAVRAFRKVVYESAMAHLVSSGQSTADYRAFREALTRMFHEFDVDKDGQLDVSELVAGMATFKLQLNGDNVALLRELFVGERDSDTVGVAEFISFVLAHSARSEQDLSLLGYRLREAILARVKTAQAHVDSVEEAVRAVFAAAYPHKGQEHCSIRDFVYTLRRLRLGISAAQLALLAVRLDRDGDRTVSFEELLIWLRIRSKDQASDSLDSDYLSASQSALQRATTKARVLRGFLGKLASSSNDRTASLTALFRQIDQNDSGKINESELQRFLERLDLPGLIGDDDLTLLCGVWPLPEAVAALVAKETMRLLDLNGNGVATLHEWLTFARHASEDDDPAVIEAMRRALKDTENHDPERVLRWFNGLPGAMRAADPEQVKVRVGEFKSALRAKLGGARSVSLRTIDRVVESLDKDGSGWITTSELCAWAFPPRDLEELLRLVIKSWQPERLREPTTAFATSLYNRFDADGNGSLAVREIVPGFASFGLTLTEYEARVLLVAFDLDGDGCWSKREFEAFVDKLFPIETPEATDEHTKAPVGSDYSDDDLSLQSSSSNISNEQHVGVLPVDYSEDFDDGVDENST